MVDTSKLLDSVLCVALLFMLQPQGKRSLVILCMTFDLIA